MLADVPVPLAAAGSVTIVHADGQESSHLGMLVVTHVCFCTDTLILLLPPPAPPFPWPCPWRCSPACPFCPGSRSSSRFCSCCPDSAACAKGPLSRYRDSIATDVGSNVQRVRSVGARIMPYGACDIPRLWPSSCVSVYASASSTHAYPYCLQVPGWNARPIAASSPARNPEKYTATEREMCLRCARHNLANRSRMMSDRAFVLCTPEKSPKEVYGSLLLLLEDDVDGDDVDGDGDDDVDEVQWPSTCVRTSRAHVCDEKDSAANVTAFWSMATTDVQSSSKRAHSRLSNATATRT